VARSPSPEVAARSPSPEVAARSPTPEVAACSPTPEVAAHSPTPEVAARSPTPEVAARSPTPEVAARSPTPEVVARSPSPEVAARSPTPERTPSSDGDASVLRKATTLSSPQHRRSSTPERKDSRSSHGSSSYDEERASSLSPEPAKMIQTPSSTVTSPVEPPSGQFKATFAKTFTETLGDSDPDKIVHSRPASDITQIYTQKLVEKEEITSSPKLERKTSCNFKRPEGMTNISQLYTAALQEKTGSPMNSQVKRGTSPRRNGDITKLYMGGFGNNGEKAFKGKPNDEVTNPRKHNMATTLDKAAILEAYNEVMADKNEIEWAAFTFEANKLGVAAKGSDFDEFKSHFKPDDRAFGYIKIHTGDELSKRSKFVFLTWVGPNVSVMKKAKMSTDKALLKEIIQNLSVELQVETAGEFDLQNFKTEVDKAGGARYGTGV